MKTQVPQRLQSPPPQATLQQHHQELGIAIAAPASEAASVELILRLQRKKNRKELKHLSTEANLWLLFFY